MARKPRVEAHVEHPGPTEFRDPIVRREMQRAAVWFGLALAIAGVILLAHPLLLIIGGMIFAVFLDGGARMLGRVLPIARGWRLAIVIVLGFTFVGWVFWYAGTTFAEQAGRLREVVDLQITRALAFAASAGIIPEGGTAATLGQQLLGSVGRLTSAVGSAIGAVASFILMIVIGIFIAAEPRLYDRGIAWMLPLRYRHSFYVISDHVGWALRRLLFGRLIAMLFEGVATWILLTLAGVPMAALLGLITGLLAFIPNIGAIISGVLMVSVGFSAGPNQGIAAIAIYFLVQNFDAYVIVPYIAKRAVDLAPALVLAMQLLMGAMFGILGVLFADPILAALKVTLVELSKLRGGEQSPDPGEPEDSTRAAAARPGRRAVPGDP
ncbi:MAG TPA: AI-2E family transporter [Sphingomicrobium sp.]|nr:AI-2E family transporter [Sphingomicrobium sp.]